MSKPSIAYVPSDMDAPGCYRCLFPGRQLGQNGYQVMLPDKSLVDAPDGKRRFHFDVSFKPPKPAAELWVLQSRFERVWAEEGVALLRNQGIATVADVDDNYEELPAWNPAFFGTHPYRRDDGVIVNRSARRKMQKDTGFKIPPNKQNRWHMRETFKQVDAITVSTPYLKELYAPYNGNIHVVRNYVDWDMWENIQPQYQVRRDDGRIRIGYPGVFRFRQGDLKVIQQIVRPILDRYPHVDFVANSKQTHDFLNVPLKRRITVPEYDFLNIDTNQYEMPAATAVMDIGLVPLAPGGMSEAKSHLKGMELNAAGIPYVASNTESYRYFMSPGGFIAENAKEFMETVCYLIENDEERRWLGERGRRYVIQDHTIQTNWHHSARVYEKVIGGGHKKIARASIRVGAVQKVSELEWLLDKAATIKPKVIVEVGSARGGTFWAFSMLCDPNGLMVSIDIPEGSPLDVRDGKDVYGGRNRERMREFVGPEQRCVLIDGNSQTQETFDKLVDTLGVTPIDFLFIDADHRYEGVKRDYELYSPLVRKGGMIAFHDMIPQNDTRSGVHRLWQELKETQTTDEYVGRDNWGYGSWGGVGVVIK